MRGQASAGIQGIYTPFSDFLDSRFRGNDARKLRVPRWLRFNLRAAIEIDKEVEYLIKVNRSFVVETVLSSRKYRDDILAAKHADFRIGLVYISLYPPELSPLRVSERTAKGGHDVETAKAIERHNRSHNELVWFAPQADILMVFDNSANDGSPILVASRVYGKALKYLHRGLNPAIDAALNAAFPEKLAMSRFDHG
ncbi:MAG: hypothetical protein HQL74_07755 [Magnetococcales bacterium]|nr:hypothetical protein [Magnetococcales bacterium]